MKKSTIIVFYLILILTGMAISSFLETKYDEVFKSKSLFKDKTKKNDDLIKKIDTVNGFNNLENIYSYYYSNKAITDTGSIQQTIKAD